MKKTIFLSIILALLLSLHLIATFQQQLITDEWETIATARFMHEGKIIFKDFFQHHGVIPYFVYSMAFELTDSKILSIYLMKTLSFIFLCMAIYLLYIIIKKLTMKKSHIFIWFIPIYVLLNDIIWWRYSTQIRTDVFMIILLLLTFFFLLLQRDTNLNRYLFFAGFFSSAAFFSKQYSAIIVCLFLIFYFRSDLKKYIIFFAGTIPPGLIYILYFSMHKALPYFLRYFISFNVEHFPKSTFGFQERTWWVYSQVTPFYIKILYIAGATAFIITCFCLFKKCRKKYGRFFVALFLTSFVTLIITYLLKTPYPQYYMPLQVIFCILAACCLALLKQYRKIYITICAAVICVAPIITYYHFRDMSTHRVTLAKQTKALERIIQKLPADLKMLGATPMLLALEPASFYWYYPPIFVDIDLNFLLDDLKKADVVFYDSTMYSLAPKKFKQTLFDKWHFVDHFYFPFSVTGRHDAISVFVKDKEQIGTIKASLKETSKPAGLLKNPLYIPAYSEVELLSKNEKMLITKPNFEHSFNAPEEFSLNILVSTDASYFDEITNSIFAHKPLINYSKTEKGIVFEVHYTEARDETSNTWLGSVGRRATLDNKPSYKGIIRFSYNHKPKSIYVKKLKNGYKVTCLFLAEDFSLQVDAHEKRTDTFFY